MIATLSNAFMTATRMDGFSYTDQDIRKAPPAGSALARVLRALCGPARRPA